MKRTLAAIAIVLSFTAIAHANALSRAQYLNRAAHDAYFIAATCGQ